MPTLASKHSLTELSGQFGLRLLGNGDLTIDGVGTLVTAGPSQVTFLANPYYRKHLPTTRAGAVILKQEDAESCLTNCLVAEDPYLAYARMASLFDQRPTSETGVHPTAVIAGSVKIGSGVSIAPHVVVGEDCEIGEGCVLGPGVVLEAECCLGPGCQISANVLLGHGVQLGKRVLVHPGAIIGADGFGIAFAVDHWEKVPQLGAVVIGDDSEIGANTCIDRGAVGNTVLEEDVHIDNLCQIGHNVRIGAHTAVAGATGIAGSTSIGKYCLIGGGAGISGHLEIADRTTVSGGSQVYDSIVEPGKTWSGHLPSTPIVDWNRNLARLRKLDKLARKVRALELQIGKNSNNEK